jgi:hypothetical protein
MKKSKSISLILITAALASCNKKQPDNEWEAGNKTYLRSDTTAPYTNTRHHFNGASALLWYYAFRPYGGFSNGIFNRSGFYSNAINHNSNVGVNAFKSGVRRGGFGGTYRSSGSRSIFS